MDPRDGAIRAMASKPNFDLNFFSKDFKPQKEYDELFNSPTKPLLNRALNAYDPGSIWKIVTAIAGLESGKFPSETLLETKPKNLKNNIELLSVLKIILKLISNELNISKNLIATTSDLEKLNFKNNKHSRLFKSWRNEVFGEKIKKFFKNELKIVSKENNFFLEKN